MIYERKSPSRSQNAGAGLVPRTGSHPRRGGVDPEKRLRGTIAGNNLQCISEEWWEDTSFEGHPPAASQLADFTPKSVSAVAKAAAVYVKKLADQVHGDGEQPKKQRKAQHKRSDRARGKAVASDAESDCQSDADDA